MPSTGTVSWCASNISSAAAVRGQIAFDSGKQILAFLGNWLPPGGNSQAVEVRLQNASQPVFKEFRPGHAAPIGLTLGVETNSRRVAR